MDQQLASLADQITTLKNLSTQIAKEFRSLQKQYDRERKIDHGPKKRRRGKKPSGFASPSEVTPALKDFLGLDRDSKIARTEVTKLVIAYVKEHKLNSGTKINLDDKLRTIITAPADSDLSFFNLQTHINHHFLKSTTT